MEETEESRETHPDRPCRPQSRRVGWCRDIWLRYLSSRQPQRKKHLSRRRAPCCFRRTIACYESQGGREQKRESRAARYLLGGGKLDGGMRHNMRHLSFAMSRCFRTRVTITRLCGTQRYISAHNFHRLYIQAQITKQRDECAFTKFRATQSSRQQAARTQSKGNM